MKKEEREALQTIGRQAADSFLAGAIYCDECGAKIEERWTKETVEYRCPECDRKRS